MHNKLVLQMHIREKIVCKSLHESHYTHWITGWLKIVWKSNNGGIINGLKDKVITFNSQREWYCSNLVW